MNINLIENVHLTPDSLERRKLQKESEMVASTEEYKKALLKVRNSGRLRNGKFLDMLRVQYASKNHTITATRLAESVGYENYNAANLQYGTLGHELADALGYAPPERQGGDPIWFWAISYGREASEETIDGHYEFIMRPELVAALEEMRWVKIA